MEGLELVVAVLEDGSDSKRASASVGEFGDGAGGAGAVEFHGCVDDVVDLKGSEVPVRVGAVCCFEAAVFGEDSEDFGGEDGLALAEAEEVVEVVHLGVRRWDLGNCCEIAVKRESEGSADSWDAANDVGAINSGGVPGVVGTVNYFG